MILLSGELDTKFKAALLADSEYIPAWLLGAPEGLLSDAFLWYIYTARTIDWTSRKGGEWW
jgi:hypothetical protein